MMFSFAKKENGKFFLSNLIFCIHPENCIFVKKSSNSTEFNLKSFSFTRAANITK